MRWGVLVLTALLLGCAHGVEVRPVGMADVDGDFVQQGRTWLRQGNPAMALQRFRLALREQPHSVTALNGVGVAYDMLGRYDLSARYYQLALADAPRDRRVLTNMAASLRMQGRDAEARVIDAEMRGEVAVVSTPAERDAARALLRTLDRLAMLDAPAPERVALGLAVPVPVSVAASLAVPVAVPVVAPVAAAEADAVPARAPVVEHLPIYLVNAVGEHGVARRLAEQLRAKGWVNIQLFDTPERLAETRVEAPARFGGGRVAALRSALPFATSLGAGDGRAVVVRIGRNAVEGPHS